jgi:hypothetical protein
MTIWPYALAIFIVIVIALWGTLAVGRSPADKNYGTLKRRIINLSLIYIISTLFLLIIFYIYV